MSKLKLRSKDYVPFALKSAGIVRINHSDTHCSGSSNSLIITTRSDGTITGKCFRCGAVGLTLPRGFARVSHPSETAPVRPYRVEIPADVVDWHKFPMEAKAWLMKARVSDGICRDYGVKWSPKFGTLVFPIWDREIGTLSAVVHRGFREDNRYRLLTEDADKAFMSPSVPMPVPLPTYPFVIVEDSVSCIRTNQAGFPCAALLGVQMRKGLKSYLIRHKVKKVVVWLDNDNTKVKLRAREIAKELSWLTVKIVSDKTDPKHHSDEEIREIVWKA